jgi:NhaP-type Na+/H+ or K+/H+ antiporter
METVTFVVIAVFILGFGMISARIQRSIFTPPMIFVFFGVLMSGQIFGLVDIEIQSELITTIAELTLVLVLFTDAARIDLKGLRREHNLPVRLLSAGLPLSVLLGAILAVLIFKFVNIWQAVVLAVILAPTDAALGQAVVSNHQIPVRVRQALNVESGLNDGIALPILLFFISLAGVAAGLRSAGYWLRFAGMQILLGPLVGVAVGFLGGRAVSWGSRQGWITHSFQDLAALGLSLLAYACAELISGNGFIAAFCAGLTLGNTARPICNCLYEFAEAEGQLLTLLTFTLFGAVMVFPALDHLSWQILLYAGLSLTVVRVVPVAVSLIGARLQPDTVVFLGWFGPRGIASILYGLLVLTQSDLVGREQIFSVTVITVLLSVLLHGLTAWPGAKLYAASAEKMKDEPELPEMQPVTEMPVRLPFME